MRGVLVNLNKNRSLKEFTYDSIISFAQWKRTFYLKRRKKKLKCNGFTIISNNCLAGYLYHDLGLKFLTPTINLQFETDDDYIEFLSHLEYYSASEPKEIQNNKVSWPVGEIVRGQKRVTIHFIHYNSFDEAKTKWLERGMRINSNRMIVLWLVMNEAGPSEKLYKRFNQMNYKNKLLITGKQFPYDDTIVKKLRFIDKDSTPGKWAKYRWMLSNKRYIYDMDFVELFNEIF